MNSKQVLAAVSAVVLIFILVYPTVSVGTVSVSLASARISNVDHVYLTIDRVLVHPKGQPAGTGWVVVSNQSVSADLVSLQNSTKLIGSGQMASGQYDAIRIEVSNVTWISNGTTMRLGIASPEIDGTINFTVGTAKATTIVATVSSREELIANSEYFTGTLNATLTS